MSLAYTFREVLAKLHVADIEKFNPYHGPDGRFTTGSGATSFTIRTKDPGKQHMVGQAVVAEAANQIRNLDHEESRIITPDGRMLHFTSGGEHEVAMTVGEKREYAPGAIVMHNHPSGGTFSPDDLHDLGYRPKEMRAVAPEGDYVMRAADPNETPHWPKLRDAILEAENSQFKSSLMLRKEIFEQKYRADYEEKVGSIANQWVEQKKSGAPQETLDATFKQWEAAEAAWNKKHPKADREAEAERAYLDQYHNFYREHAAEHGIVYEFEPQVKKYNHNHDPATGRFTTGNGGGDLSKYGAMIRKDPPPKKTIKAYKAFIVKDGKLYPPMVANPSAMDTPRGVWLDAQEGQRAGESKTGRPQVKAGGKGTKGGSGQLAYRPGWHLGDIPLATQFFTRNKETGEKEMYPNLVFAECEIAADHDYQDEAMSYGYTENGKFRHSYAGLPKIPKDGYYTYRTNPDPTTRPWYITGAMKVGKILTDSEADKIIRDSGNTPMKRKDGPLTKEKLDALMSGKVKKGRNPNGCGVLVVQDGKVLVGTRIDSESKGQICGPGGHVESGEPTIEAARREAFEEFGIVCHDLKRLDRQDGGRDYGKSDVFLCTKFSGTPTTDEEEMTEPRWVDPGELTDNLFPPFEQSLKLLPNIKKYNHNHDPATGRFSSGTKSGRDKSYQITHRPPTRGEVDDEEASYAYDIDLMMPGFYENQRSYTGYYHDGSKEESISALLDIHGNPEAEVTVYRGSPKNELNDGDWVSLSRKYAEQYAGDGAYSSEGAEVHAFKVKAKDLTFDGNSINEFGFRPADGVEKSQTFWKALLRKFNENHDPATGRFTYGSGGSVGSRKTRGHLEREFSMTRAEGVKQIMADTGHDYGTALEDYQVLFGWSDSTTICSEIRRAQRGELKGFREKAYGKSGDILEKYIADAPQWDAGTLFRGVSGREMDKYYDHLKVGDVIDMGGASSWTSDLYAAASFAGHGAVFTWEEPKNCTSISHLSPHIGEGEVVASKSNTFSVSRIEEIDSKKVIFLSNVEAVQKFNENHDPKTGRFTFSSGGASGGVSGYQDNAGSPFGDATTGEEDQSKQERRNKHSNPKKMSGGGEVVRYAGKQTRGHVKLVDGWKDLSDQDKERVAEKQIQEELKCSDDEARRYASAIKQFTGDVEVYEQLRRCQRGEAKGLMDKQAIPTAQRLDEYLERAPQWDGGPIYRGISPEEHKFYQGLQKGDVIDMGGASSWTSDISVAATYTEGDGELFIVKNPTKGTSIKHLSYYPGESEVAVSSSVHYRVTHVSYDADGMKITWLTQCRLPVERQS